MTATAIRHFVALPIGMTAAYLVVRQCRKPAGWLGRRLARAMNASHARLTTWGLSHLHIGPDWRILDIGCGGGQTIRSMATLAPAGRIEGIDYSPASVAVARDTNADLIASGRVAIQQASVSSLPFSDASFDLIAAIETHYYWPELVRDLREVLRVTKPGGRVAIIAEAYRGRPMDWLYLPVMRGLLRSTYLSLDEHRTALADAGFSDVDIHAERSRGWMCAVGVRPW